MAAKFVMRITFLLLLAVAYGLAEGAPPMAKPGCPDRCGNISIPYPFGIGSACFMHQSHEIVCNESGAASRAFLPSIKMEVLEINISQTYSSEPGLMRVKMPIISSSNCTSKSSDGVDISGSPYFFSSYRNNFVSVGCNILAIMAGLDPMVVVGCKTNCRNTSLLINNQLKCSGFNCCQTKVPSGIQVLHVL